MDTLKIDFSKLTTFDAIKTEVLAFLKALFSEIRLAPDDPPTAACDIHERGAGADYPRHHRIVLYPWQAGALDSHAGKIAAELSEYAKGKDGRVFSHATVEIHHRPLPA